jgi:hypothetical protein
MMGKPQMEMYRDLFPSDNQIIMNGFNILRTKDQ